MTRSIAKKRAAGLNPKSPSPKKLEGKKTPAQIKTSRPPAKREQIALKDSGHDDDEELQDDDSDGDLATKEDFSADEEEVTFKKQGGKATKNTAIVKKSPATKPAKGVAISNKRGQQVSNEDEDEDEDEEDEGGDDDLMEDEVGSDEELEGEDEQDEFSGEEEEGGEEDEGDDDGEEGSSNGSEGGEREIWRE